MTIPSILLPFPSPIQGQSPEMVATFSRGNDNTLGAKVNELLTALSSSSATSATTGTMTVSMTTRIVTITPTGDCTFNASGGSAGQVCTFSVTTSGVTSYNLTFGTNFRSAGVLATGTTSARFFAVTFLCLDGTVWQETARTTVET